MIFFGLHSGFGLGTDLAPRRREWVRDPEGSNYAGDYKVARIIRVVVGRLGDTFRLSALELEIVTEGESIERAWEKFLLTVGSRDDAAWLIFDVGPTRPEEVEAGLNAPEDEDWAQPADASGED